MRLVAFFLTVACSTAARADNAAFALAPRDATIAIDARGFSEVLGPGGDAIRSVLSVLAGEPALATFDALARRSRAGAEVAAREVFAGRVAFFAVDNGREPARWMFGVEADDARCERVLKMLGARMDAPGRFTSTSEKLLFLRVGGWLLMSPIALGERALEEASRRVAKEDPAVSLLGEPLVQGFLGSDAPVRIFVRHGAPVGGATTIGLSRAGNALRAEVRGDYDDSPLGAAIASAPLDERLVRALDGFAALVVVNPTDGLTDPSDAFWIALVPELSASPAMRSNLAGERLLAIGPARTAESPAIALAWRVDDAAQAESEQDLFMHGVCCGMARAVEGAPTSPARGSDGAVRPIRAEESDAPNVAGARPASNEAGTAAARRVQQPEPAIGGPRECAALGGFADRYLGSGFKLGKSVLCWSTVTTDCGGWQLYASDPQWLRVVADRLRIHTCAGAQSPKAAGLGLCDGPRAAKLIRSWRPLIEGDGAGMERISRGLDAMATTLEGLGRISFRYETPNNRTLQAVVEFDLVSNKSDGAAP